MFCSNCGRKLEDGAMFCGECGTKVEASPVADAAPTEEATPAQEEPPTVDKPKKEKKKGKGKTVAVIIIILLILAAGGVAAWYFTGDDFNSKRNMKKAEEAFAAGELESAREFYKSALERDATLTDAYLKLAEMDLQTKPEEAVKTLVEGIKNTEDVEGAKELLTPKLQEAYNVIIDAKIHNLEYIDALATANAAFDATHDAAFTEKKAEVYSIMVKYSCRIADYKHALELVEQGYNETRSDILVASRVELYKEWIAHYLEKKDFDGAYDCAKEAYNATNDSCFSEELLVEIYKEWAEYKISKDEYDSASFTLDSGICETNSEVLKRMMAEIDSKRIITKKREICSDGSERLFIYDEKGKELEIDYYEDGSLLSSMFYSYDENGELSTITQTDADGNVMTITEYTQEELDGQKVQVISVRDGEGKPSCETKETEDGKMLSYVYVVYDGDVGTVYSQEYTYDEQGNLTGEKWATDGEVVSEVTNEYTYDANGKVTQKLHTEADGSTTLTIYGDNTETVKMFDSNQELILESETILEKDGKVKEYSVSCEEYSFTEAYTYDAEGNILTFEYNDLISGTNKVETYYYDVTDGKKVVYCHIDENGKNVGITMDIYGYAENGDLLYHDTIDKNGVTVYMQAFGYNWYGNIDYRREKNLESDIETSIEYEYSYVK